MPKGLKVFTGVRYYTCSEEVYVVAASIEEAEQKIEEDKQKPISHQSEPEFTDAMIQEEVQTITIRLTPDRYQVAGLPNQIRLIPEPFPQDVSLEEVFFHGYLIDEEKASVADKAFSYPKNVWKLVSDEQQEEQI